MEVILNTSGGEHILLIDQKIFSCIHSYSCDNPFEKIPGIDSSLIDMD